MKTITTDELVTVAGGTTRANEALTAQLTSLQSSIKDVATNSNNNNNCGSNSMMMMMGCMMAQRQQAPAVVAAEPAASPIINVSTRVGRRW